MKLTNRTAVITGAASGIGRGIALALANRQCHLALVDVNEEGLAQTAAMVAPYGVKVSCHWLDVSDPQAIAGFPEIVKAEHAGVDVLVNNAGVAVGGTFEQVSEEDFEWLISINFWGVVRMTRAFLPLLKRSSEARIVNISSLFGLIAPPGQTAYCASKFAVRGFSESLRKELKGTSVGVTVVHPGGVNTSIAVNARRPAGVNEQETAQELEKFKKMLVMPPEQAGEIIVKAVERNQARVLVGSDAKLLAFLERLFPVAYWKIVERIM